MDLRMAQVDTKDRPRTKDEPRPKAQGPGTKPRIAITVGDPAGIGPEIAACAAADPRVLDVCDPVLFGPSPGATFPPGVLSAEAGRASYDAIVRAVEAARRGDVIGREELQHVPQPAGIVRDGPNPRLGEDLREHALHHRAVFEHVGDAGWTAQVVLEHVNLTVAMPHQVCACDMAPDSARRIEPYALLPIRP